MKHFIYYEDRTQDTLKARNSRLQRRPRVTYAHAPSGFTKSIGYKDPELSDRLLMHWQRLTSHDRSGRRAVATASRLSV